MPRLNNPGDLKKLREEVLKEVRIKNQTETRIIIGLGTCGIGAGAKEVLQAVIKELEKRKINVSVETVGCIGMCHKEPLVEIEQGIEPRVTYANVSPEMVPRIIEQHLVKGQVIKEWVIGRLDSLEMGRETMTSGNKS